MSDSGKAPVNSNNFNVPNTLSAIRLCLSMMVVVLIPAHQFLLAFILFLIAAGTDWVDGWWARKFKQITQLGRILDPFCDKMIICGTFICLTRETGAAHFPWYADIHPVLVVLVVGRELLVTALRSFIEQAGGDFSAKMAAKLKMVFQCIAGATALWALHRSEANFANVDMFVRVILVGSVWLTLIFTLYSGWEYVLAAAKFIRSNAKAGSTPSSSD
jgi:CDP-diacylglycerol---glycerol-3-phosphate 3-phosphatidyltransferase